MCFSLFLFAFIIFLVIVVVIAAAVITFAIVVVRLWKVLDSLLGSSCLISMKFVVNLFSFFLIAY